MCVCPIRIRHPTEYRFIDVPCGKCVECLEKRRNEWSLRLQQELKNSSMFSYFITLTYDDMNLPLIFDDNDLPISFTLDREHLKSFVRSFRDALRYKIKKLNNSDVYSSSYKYFCVGEYGEKSIRPHYHGMFFNVPLDIDDFSKLVEKIWNKGFVQVGYLHDGGCHYQAKYMVKPSGLPDSAIKPFLLCSKKLGISYLTDDMIKYHLMNDIVQIVQSSKKFAPALPRYYRDRIWNDSSITDKLKLRYIDYVNDIVNRQFKGDVRLYEQNRNSLIAKKTHQFYKRLKHRVL